MNLTRRNIRTEELKAAIRKLGNKPKKLTGTVYAVYQKPEGQDWHFILGRYSPVSEAKQLREEYYRDCAFVSKPVPSITIDAFINMISDQGFELSACLPPIEIKVENPSWSEEIVPTHASGTEFPLRRFPAEIVKDAYFTETQLIAYGKPFYLSATEYIKQFLGLSHFYGHSDARKGELMLEFTDRRGAISIENNTLSISGPENDLCLVGQINKDHKICLNKDETEKIDSKEIRQIELWLLTKEDEIIDYRSSSEWPHKYEAANENAQRDQLHEIIAKGESEHCEFKPYVTLTDKFKLAELERSICAFSNTHGGKLFIGIEDDGELTGISRELTKAYGTNVEQATARYIKELGSYLRECFKNNQCFEIESTTLRGCRIIVINVTDSSETNYLIEKRQAYVRRGATDMKMSIDEIESRATAQHGFGV